MPPALQNPILHLVLAAVLGGLGVFLLLPRPKGRWVAGGVALLLIGVGVFVAFLILRFGQPLATADGSTTDWVGSGLFWLFAAGAVGFAAVLVANRNPARGAIAFAFVILSSCGLFLLLAAPFLMAATVIIYAGAIIVTFLFVLMLSNVRGPSDENDRSREPLLGALAGFAFLGLILFTLHQAAPTPETALTGGGWPEPPITPAERKDLSDAHAELVIALDPKQSDTAGDHAETAYQLVEGVVGKTKGGTRTLPERLSPTQADPRVKAILNQAEELRLRNKSLGDKTLKTQVEFREDAETLRALLTVFLGNGHLPARNVENLGVLLYSEHLLAVEMAGTLLLVATVGAVAIAGRRREGAA